MGSFSNAVRHRAIEGPDLPAFDIEVWLQAFRGPESDDDDRSMAGAGLFFDYALRRVRSRMAFDEFSRSSDELARLAIASLNMQYCEIVRQRAVLPLGESAVDISKQCGLSLIADGQPASMDEVLTVAIDGLAYFLQHNARRPKRGTVRAGPDRDSALIQYELNNAIMYHVVVEYWKECWANGHRLVSREGVMTLVADNPKHQMARAASDQLRWAEAFDAGNEFFVRWRRLTRSERIATCGILLAKRAVIEAGRLESIELDQDDETMDANLIAIQQRMAVEDGPYAALLDIPLPGLTGVTLRMLMKAWQFVHSVATVLYDTVSTFQATPTDSCSAPVIPRFLINRSLARALNISESHATRLVGALSLSPKIAKDLWSQPMVKFEDGLCIVLPAICVGQLLRIVETWMRMYGLSLTSRGQVYENFCRVMLQSASMQSSIARSVFVFPEGTKLRYGDVAAGGEQQYDIIVLIGDTILVLESKCFLWPDDAIRFGNQKDELTHAADQINNQLAAARANYPIFSARLREMGHEPPRIPRILGAVVTNTGILAGQSINGVPVVDLRSICTFLTGVYKSVRLCLFTGVPREHHFSLYKTVQEASQRLASYLARPPGLGRYAAQISQRNITVHFDSGPEDKFVHETYYANLQIVATREGNIRTAKAAAIGNE